MMPNSIRQWLSSLLNKRPAPLWRQDLDDQLREARPAAPELSESQAAMMLAAAFAQSRNPLRMSAGPIAILAACAVIVLAIIGLRGFNPRLTDSRPVQSPAARNYVRVEKHSPPASRKSLKTHAIVARKLNELHEPGRRRVFSSRVRRPHYHNRSTHRANAELENLQPAQDDYVSISTALLAYGAEQESPGRSEQGRLVVIVDEPAPPPSLNVILTTDEPATTGYAKVACYMPVGPGGGVLTQATVHEADSEEGASTSKFGIVFGEPASRLLYDCSETGDTPALTEKE
jgi:hypothetical protein